MACSGRCCPIWWRRTKKSYRAGLLLWRRDFLLDEPTAALDPIAEYETYTQFNKMIAEKTAVLVTYRLSAVQLANKVAVFNDG